MKKLPAFVLTLTLLLAITCGCSSANNGANEPTQPDAPQTDTNQPDTPPADDPSQVDTPPEEPEIVPYGTCGEKLNWELTDDGILTISGTGKMEDSVQPWSNYLESITSVVIEEGATTIGSGAFAGCANLVSIVIPDSMITIGESAFDGCSSLTGVDIPGSVKIIGDGAFSGCSSLADVYFGGDDWAWSGISVGEGNDCLSNAALTCVIAEGTCGDDLTWTLTDDGVLTISGTGAMTDPDVPLPPWVSYRENISSVVIEDGATTIGNYAFCFCPNLTSATLPDGITYIGNQAFSHSGLTSVTLPGSVTSMGDYVFQECTGLTSVTIVDGVASLGYGIFWGCTSLTSIEIPNSVTYIGSSAFNFCTSLTNVKLSSSITSIEDYAFGHTNLTSITIPAGVTSIGNGAFNNCSALTTVYFCGTEEQWNAISIGEFYNDYLKNAEIVFG